MYSVFIVDDEPSARNGLRTYIDWPRLNLQVVGEASDGADALVAMTRLRPDIVISDIKMPNMDGIEMCTRLKAIHETVQIIFMSAYSDLNFLKAAFDIEAIDYVLKPINLGEMEAVIERAVARLQEKQSHQRLVEQMDLLISESMPLLRDKFFQQLIAGSGDDTDRLTEQLTFLDLDFPVDGSFGVLVIDLDDQAALLSATHEHDRQLSVFLILSICRHLIANQSKGYAFESGNGEFVGIIPLDGDNVSGKLELLASQIISDVMVKSALSVTVGVSPVANGLNMISQTYREARKAVGRRLYIGKGQVITADPADKPPAAFYLPDPVVFDTISAAVEAADLDLFTAVFHETINKVVEKQASLINVNIVCTQILMAILDAAMQLDPVVGKKIWRNEAHLCHNLFINETIDGFKESVLSLFTHVCTQLSDQDDSKQGYVVQKIKTILHQRYRENLTIQELADAVYLTHTYLCIVFKKETGMTINDYLTAVRMEKAKELLLDPQNKIYTVCNEVGYADPSYFSKLFKRYHGISPVKYRNKVINVRESEDE
jgi:two-component system response regulator YesN